MGRRLAICAIYAQCYDAAEAKKLGLNPGRRTRFVTTGLFSWILGRTADEISRRVLAPDLEK